MTLIEIGLPHFDFFNNDFYIVSLLNQYIIIMRPLQTFKWDLPYTLLCPIVAVGDLWQNGVEAFVAKI